MPCHFVAATNDTFLVQWAEYYLITEMVIKFTLLIRVFFLCCYKIGLCNTIVTCLVKSNMAYIDFHLKI